MPVEFRLLGGIEAEVDHHVVDLGPARQRLVLAALLLGTNRPIPAERLINRIWGTTPPPTASSTLRSYLTRLRGALSGAAAIERRAGGYLLVVSDDAVVDVHRFSELVASARSEVDHERAISLFETALRLWKGEALAGVSSDWATEMRADLLRQRHSAQVDYTDLKLRIGQHADVLPELLRSVRDHPMDERICGQLMIALYRSARQADALTEYDRMRRLLSDELGVSPSAELQALYEQMLSHRVPSAQVQTPNFPVPRQLPAPPGWFTGREPELRELDDICAAAGERRTVAIAAVTGNGGVGKTSTALHWAHRRSSEFPDGQLYADLRGFDPAASPVPTAVVLRGFLEALGIAGSQIPVDVDAQAALYRSTLAGRKVLIVLDNAKDSAHVVALLPGSVSCMVVVTSRDRLLGLITAHGAKPVQLDVLPTAAARALLAARVGAAPLAQDGTATDEILRFCAGLPLALSILAGRLAVGTAESLSALAAELHDRTTRMNAFDEGEATASLPVVLSCSFTALPEEHTRMASLLGLTSGPDTTVLAAANLADLDPGEAATILRGLERLSLVRQTRPGRYQMHDLVKLYAAHRAQTGELRSAVPGGLYRLLAYYTDTALKGNQLLHPHGVLVRSSAPDPDGHPHHHAFSDAASVLAWFDAEHACLLAAQREALKLGHAHLVWQLAWALTAYHHRIAAFHHDLAVCEAALEAADSLGEPAISFVVHRRAGLAAARCGRHAMALEHLNHALELAEDLPSQAIIRHNLAQAWEQHGDDREALNHAMEALHRFSELDNPVWQAQALNGVGWYLTRLGEHEQAEPYCEKALLLYQEHNHVGAADVLDSLGHIAHHTGRYATALDRYRQALLLYRESENTYMEADTLDHLGHTHIAIGDHARAVETWLQALALYRAQRRLLKEEDLRARLASVHASAELPKQR
jgi:DNA-binding SARP family transcriptional activator/Tfp pilus assembly protein PilF